MITPVPPKEIEEGRDGTQQLPEECIDDTYLIDIEINDWYSRRSNYLSERRIHHYKDSGRMSDFRDMVMCIYTND